MEGVGGGGRSGGQEQGEGRGEMIQGAGGWWTCRGGGVEGGGGGGRARGADKAAARMRSASRGWEQGGNQQVLHACVSTLRVHGYMQAH